MLAKAAAWLPGHRILSRADRFSPGRVADHHPREQKQRGGEFSTTPNYSFLGYSGTMKVTPDPLRTTKHHRQKRLPPPVRPRASAGSQLSGGRFPGNDKGTVAALPRDCKAVRSVAEAEDHGHTATAAQWTIISAW